jgi:hypothetical protein
MEEAREKAATYDLDGRIGKVGAVLIVSVWVIVTIGIVYLIWLRPR